MYTVPYQNLNGHSFSVFGRSLARSVFGLLLSFQKARIVGGVAARNLYDQETIQRTMFTD